MRYVGSDTHLLIPVTKGEYDADKNLSLDTRMNLDSI